MYFPIPPHEYDKCINIYHKGLSKKIYEYCSDDEMLCYYKSLKWQRELGISFCEDLKQYLQYHLDLYKVTNIPKYRSFQYRLLQRGLVTNIQLCAWGICESDTCSFCTNERETVIHLLIECICVQELWKELWNYIEESYGISTDILNISGKGIISGQVHERKNHLINFLVLIVKQYVYRQRCLKQPLNFQNVKGIIRKIESIEKYIAVKNDRVRSHNIKWRIGNQIDSIEGNYIRRYIEGT